MGIRFTGKPSVQDKSWVETDSTSSFYGLPHLKIHCKSLGLPYLHGSNKASLHEKAVLGEGLNSVKAAIDNEELGAQLEAVSGALKAGFKK
jgi:hypothetical protein